MATLEQSTPSQALDTKQLDRDIDALSQRLGDLQRQMKAAGIPMVIALEGGYGSGKSAVAAQILLALDSRITDFYPTLPSTKRDRRRPFMWQYQNAIPAYGNTVLFFRSWYALYRDYCEKKKKRAPYTKQSLLDSMRNFESMLVEDGFCLVKLLIEADAAVVKKRLKRFKESPVTMWKAEEAEARQGAGFTEDMRELLSQTDTTATPWTYVTYDKSEKLGVLKALTALEEAMTRALADKAMRDQNEALTRRDSLFVGREGPIDTSAPQSLSREDYQKQKKALQDRLGVLMGELYKRKISMILVFEGQDAAGKGGAIVRLRENMDPFLYEVKTTAAPTQEEKNHHYLWRFAKETPLSGQTVIWDRSWYGRVMVERVEGFATTAQWQRAYQEINRFEAGQSLFGSIVLKFWIDIDYDEQLQRFNDRQNDPDKQWKITEEDWRNRAKWPQYVEAVLDMLDKTNTPNAPWIIVPGKDKYFARVMVLKSVVEAIEKRLAE